MVNTYSFKVLQIIYLLLLPTLFILIFYYDGFAGSIYMYISALSIGVINEIIVFNQKKKQYHIMPMKLKNELRNKNKTNRFNDDSWTNEILSKIDLSIKN